jgi:hypothetical protein
MSEAPMNNPINYYLALLKLMASLPSGQAARPRVHESFWQQHHDQIPPQHVEPRGKSTQAYWKDWVDASRSSLVYGGLMDSPATGIWRISPAGRDWVARNPLATVIPVDLRPRKSNRASGTGRPIQESLVRTSGAITVDMLEQTRRVMPAEQFRQVWGALYDRQLAEARAESVTAFTDKSLLAAVRQPVRRIQDFLQGRGTDSPKSEEVCDWIQFSYTLGMYREAAALWQYVRQDDASPWQYDRTKKIASACRARVGL